MAYSCDVNEIMDYLEHVSDRDHFHLIKISSKSDTAKPQGKVIADIERAAEWIATSSETGQANIFEQVNPPVKSQAKKARKSEVAWITCLHVDVDMPTDLATAGSDNEIDLWLAKQEAAINAVAKKGKPHLVMTGNGFQARWPLAKRIKATDDTRQRVDEINAAIAHKLGADDCHDCSRILRVPGTWNYPSGRKKADGYTIVKAELWFVTTDEFTLDDFKHLPAAPMKMRPVGGEHRKDWTLEDYSADYAPVTMDELLREDPLITKLATERWKEINDRSAACFNWLKACVRAFCHIFDCEAEGLLDDPDIYKNISELMIAADKPWLGHYDDQPDGFAKIGMDLQTAIYHTCDETVLSPARKRQARTRQLVESETTGERETFSLLEHRQLFIEHVRACMEQDDLPNVVRTKDHVATFRQSATESNVRIVLERAGVVARWNVMKDQAEYDVKPDAGRPLADDTDKEARIRREAPKKHFRGAMARQSPDMLSKAQEALLADAIHEQGITARNDMGVLLETIAKEDRFHPMEDYVKSKAWDGRDRIEELAECIHTEHPLVDRYLDIFFRQGCAVVHSLARWLRDGDHGVMIGSVPVLVGPQDIGKTSFWRALIPAGMKSTGEVLKPGGLKADDDKKKLLNGVVAVCDEIGAGLNYSQQEDVKNFLTATADDYRPTWGRVIFKPRMTQFVGTSNELHLKDTTGDRRYLAMDVAGFDWDRLNELLDEPGYLQQCYAQAWDDLEAGEVWWLEGEEKALREAHNARYRQVPLEVDMVEGYLNRAVGAGYRPEWLTISQIFRALNMTHNPVKARQVGDWLTSHTDLDYRDEMFVKGKRYRYVYAFPLTVDMLHRVMCR